MDLQQPVSQSDHVPYIRVARDERGSACWEVVNGDQRIRCASGHKAVEICKALRRMKGLVDT